MAWGDTRPTPATTDAYRESKLWANIEKAKKEKKDKEECKKEKSKKS